MRASLLKRPRTWIAIALGATAVAVAGLVLSPQWSERDARAKGSDTASSPTDARDRSGKFGSAIGVRHPPCLCPR